MTGPVSAPPSSRLKPGKFLADKYRIERVLGQGGMGIVVAAMHLHLRQRVAIKMLLPEIARDEKIVARFLQEARAQVRIQGDHVVRVLDVASLPCGAPMMVMELLDGSDLATVIEKRGSLPAAEAIDYVLQACEAIAQAHSLGIIHRDLKPQNMFLTTDPDGSPLVKVLDFGISKNELLSDATRRAGATTEGGLLGSPAYMSPEQIKNPKNVNARSDIWALGVILYEFLSGEMPFMAQTLTGLLQAITCELPVDIRQRRRDVPENVAAVVMRCLSRDPMARPHDVAELAHALVIDAATHARAARIASIVRRFEALPPPSIPLQGNTMANGATLVDGSSTTLFAATEEESPRDRLEWASTVHHHRSRSSRRSNVGLVLGVSAAAIVAAASAIGAIALTRQSAIAHSQGVVQTQSAPAHAPPEPPPAVASTTTLLPLAAAPSATTSASAAPIAQRGKTAPPTRGRGGKTAAPANPANPAAPPASPAAPAVDPDLYDTRK